MRNGSRSMNPIGCTVSRWLSTRIPGASCPHDERATRWSPQPECPAIRSTVAGRSRYSAVTRSASLLTWSGASVGVSISTQRRMPSRMAWNRRDWLSSACFLESVWRHFGVRHPNSGLPEFGKHRTPVYPSSANIESNSAMAGLDGARPQVRDGAPGNDGIFQIAGYLKPIRRKSARVGAVARCDLLDQFDNGAAHFGVADACKRARQRQAFGSGEEI